MKSILDKIKIRVSNQIRRRKDIARYIRLSTDEVFSIDRDRIITVYEDAENAGFIDEHYFLMDIYFSRLIRKNAPRTHYDIGSRVDGFIAQLLSADIPVTMLDIRPLPVSIDGLSFIQTDATMLKEIPDNSLESISSLHAIEHFGLGRYGDLIDPDAWKKALSSIQNKVKTGGLFYLAVPVGRDNALYFNAHRVFDPRTIVEQLSEMELVSFSYIKNYDVIAVDLNRFGAVCDELDKYECGLFCFEKR